MTVCVEAELSDMALRERGASGLQDADRNHVFRLRQTVAQRHRALESAVVVFGLPRLAAGGPGVKEQRRVVDDRRRCEAFFQGR